jgi:hypothetical protein
MVADELNVGVHANNMIHRIDRAQAKAKKAPAATP